MTQMVTASDTLLTDRKIIMEHNQIINFADIAQSIEYDDCNNEAPWESCDGWDHSIKWLSTDSNYDIKYSRGYGYSSANRQNFLITINDSDIIDKWGLTRRNGESKQVWLERIAKIKQNALNQLVRWYEEGWTWYRAFAEYDIYSDSIGGIDCYEYAEECATECALEVAAQMENNGYIVEGKPEPVHYNYADVFKYRIQYNLTSIA